MTLRVLLLCSVAGSSVLAESMPTVADAIVENYCAATRRQGQVVRGASMEVEISGSLPKFKKQGKLHALRHITALGRITYDALRFSGDNTIKKEVINRYLQQEAEAMDDSTIGVTPDNYKFKYKGKQALDGRDAYLFQVTPKKKREKLYKGELWIDAATGMPLRETGTLVKSPSIFLKKVAFVNEYKLENGVSLPSHIECHVDTRIAGRADLNILFSNIAPAREQPEQAEIADAP